MFNNCNSDVSPPCTSGQHRAGNDVSNHGGGRPFEKRLYVPWQKGFEVGDAGDEKQMFVEVREVRVRVDAVGAAALRERVEVRAGASAALGVDEEPGAPSYGERADVIFDPIVVCRDIRMLKEASQLRPLRQAVRERLAECALRRHGRREFIDPGFEGGRDWRRAGLSDLERLRQAQQGSRDDPCRASA